MYMQHVEKGSQMSFPTWGIIHSLYYNLLNGVVSTSVPKNIETFLTIGANT